MDPDSAGVKGRRYDASRRRAQAERTRAHVLDIAEQLLLSVGYAETTVAAIGRAAGVSAELIYKTFNGKAGLVREIQRRGLLGAGPIPAPERSDAIAASDLPASDLLRKWSLLSTEVAPRTAPIALLVRAAAAADAELAALLAEIADERLQRMHVNAERLLRHRGVRPDRTVEQVRDVLWTYTAPELYELLVIQRGASIEQYADFLFHGMSGQLLTG